MRDGGRERERDELAEKNLIPADTETN